MQVVFKVSVDTAEEELMTHGLVFDPVIIVAARIKSSIRYIPLTIYAEHCPSVIVPSYIRARDLRVVQQCIICRVDIIALAIMFEENFRGSAESVVFRQFVVGALVYEIVAEQSLLVISHRVIYEALSEGRRISHPVQLCLYLVRLSRNVAHIIAELR